MKLFIIISRRCHEPPGSSPHIETTLIPGDDPALNFDQPEMVNERILQFLAQDESFIRPDGFNLRRLVLSKAEGLNQFNPSF